jgi:hypothetical protein
MSREPWYDSDNPSRVIRGGMSRGLLALIALLVVGALIGGVVWVIGVATSGISGQGEAIIQKNSANNRIAAQQTFEDLIADIKASTLKLNQAAADKKANPGDATYATNYTGLVNHCLDTVGLYNADARKYTAAQFRASDLPAQIDMSDPATDCKETSAK